MLQRLDGCLGLFDVQPMVAPAVGLQILQVVFFAIQIGAKGLDFAHLQFVCGGDLHSIGNLCQILGYILNKFYLNHTYIDGNGSRNTTALRAGRCGADGER